MKIETFKLTPNRKVNAAGIMRRNSDGKVINQNVFKALKSLEFNSTEYPEIKIEDLRLNTYNGE